MAHDSFVISVFDWQECNLMWSTVVLAHTLECAMFYACWDAFLLISAHLSYYILPVSSDKSGNSPLISLINNLFQPADPAHTMFFYFYFFLVFHAIVCVISGWTAVSEILKPAFLAPTTIAHLKPHFPLMFMFDVEINWRYLPVTTWFYALHFCPPWLANLIPA